jgi:hypothetical protein
MSIGLKTASESATPAEGKEKAYELAKRFFEEFTKANGTVMCSELLGFDIGTPEGRALANERNAWERCPGFVRSAAEIFEQITGPGK